MGSLSVEPSVSADISNAIKTVSGAPSPVRRTLEQSIGAQVRLHRKLQNHTVATLAAAAGVSSGMLSKIENGQISPSLTTLQILAKALNLPISRLFAAFEEKRDCSYVPAGSGAVINRRGTKIGHQYQLLGQSPDGDIAIEPYLITLTQDATPHGVFQHEGVEFIYMLTGEVVYAHADRTYHLKPGDSLLFDSSSVHGPVDLVCVPMTYLSIIVYSRT
jgi:transcriptional regulator with XRE-family HTH domain